MNELDFSGKTVLVIGGSSGIGNGIAQGFRRRGATVHIWGTRPTSADYGDNEGSNLEALIYSAVDVGDPSAIAAGATKIPALDVLVQSQGTVLYKQQEFSSEGWNKVVAVNLDSVLLCANAFREHLSRSRGSMIIISSISAFGAAVGNPAYAASKAGAVSLTRTLGRAWARDGIRVNGIAPGYVETKLTKVTSQNQKRHEAALAQIAVGRVGTPEDMAGAVLFLASPLADYVRGQTLVVDGGLTL